MGYEMKIPVGMLFKKMSCCKCGEKLQKNKVSKINYKGDKEFKTIKYGHTVILDKKQKIENFVYYCPNCNIVTEYDEQVKISNIQKKMNKLILDHSDFNSQCYSNNL